MKLKIIFSLALIFCAINTGANSVDKSAFQASFNGALSQFNASPKSICDAACKRATIGFGTGAWTGGIKRDNSGCPHGVSCECK